MTGQPFTLMPGREVQLSSHAQPEDVCVWAADGHLIGDDQCFNGKDICQRCCAINNGCCNDGTWLDADGKPVTDMVAEQARVEQAAAAEFALSNCEAGCKVMRCKCGYLFVLHYSGYGCKTPGVQHSSTGLRCACKNT